MALGILNDFVTNPLMAFFTVHQLQVFFQLLRADVHDDTDFDIFRQRMTRQFFIPMAEFLDVHEHAVDLHQVFNSSRLLEGWFSGSRVIM